MINNNEITYRKQINIDKDYKISIKDFIKWLKEYGEVEGFKKELAAYDDYSIATDYSIPVTMVKYFRKNTF